MVFMGGFYKNSTLFVLGCKCICRTSSIERGPMSQKRPSLLTLTLLVLILFGGVSSAQGGTKAPAKQVVNVFGWHGQIPESVIKAFEGETGIHVNLDVLESNEVLEAKLLAGNTGYDVVFPTAFPYVARQAGAHLYHVLDRTKLPHAKDIDPLFKDRMQKADKELRHTLPLTWGLVAIGYNPEKIKALTPSTAHSSWAMMYDPTVVSALQSCGVTLLEDPMDVLMTYYLFTGESPTNASLKTLKERGEDLKKVRPFIRRFGTNLVAEQLGNGELCAVMHWNGILSKAQAKFQKDTQKRPFEILLPQEGTLMWIDCVAIPKDAPNLENAHRFIDFLMRPESAAAITNETDTPTTITSSYPLLKPEIRNNKVLFPDKDYMAKVVVPENSSLQFQRRLSRYFASLMTHKE